MKNALSEKIVKVTSGICLVAVAALLIFAIRGFFSNDGFIMGFALFRKIDSGSVMSFVGNLVGVALFAYGFGSMGLYGFASLTDSGKAKNAFLWGVVMTVFCLFSLIAALITRVVNTGDFILLLMSGAYTFGVLTLR